MYLFGLIFLRFGDSRWGFWSSSSLVSEILLRFLSAVSFYFIFQTPCSWDPCRTRHVSLWWPRTEQRKVGGLIFLDVFAFLSFLYQSGWKLEWWTLFYWCEKTWILRLLLPCYKPAKSRRKGNDVCQRRSLIQFLVRYYFDSYVSNRIGRGRLHRLSWQTWRALQRIDTANRRVDQCQSAFKISIADVILAFLYIPLFPLSRFYQTNSYINLK